MHISLASSGLFDPLENSRLETGAGAAVAQLCPPQLNSKESMQSRTVGAVVFLLEVETGSPTTLPLKPRSHQNEMLTALL